MGTGLNRITVLEKMIEEENGQNDSRSIVFIDGLWKMGEFIVHIHYIREMEHSHMMDEDRYPTRCNDLFSHY